MNHLRRALPYVTRASGALLVLAGAYLTHYGWYERRVRRGEIGDGSKIVDVVTGWSDSVAAWVQDVGRLRVGLVLALGLASVLTVVFAARPGKRP